MQPLIRLTRPARPEDAFAASELIALSMHEMGDALFGLDDHSRQLRVLARLFQRPGNRFSYSWTHLAESDGQIAGLLLAYPGTKQAQLNFGLFLRLWSIYDLAGGLRFIRRAALLAPYKEVETGELLVANLAVFSRFEGRGIARSLLRKAEELARGLGIQRMTLTVDLNNDRARRLYERQGYTLDISHRTPHLAALLHTRGFDRLVKGLGPFQEGSFANPLETTIE